MLSFLASIYGTVTSLRNRLYDRSVFETFDLGAPTISIGNITAGGTGKTPLVAYVAQILAAGGEEVCILTRGYGRKDAKSRVLVSDGQKILASSDQAGDEPFELAQKLLGKAIVIADADRVSAAEWAKRKFGVTAFVLDDAFQHRKVRRDLDIVCIDATDPFGGGKMLPAGRLRESIHHLDRADIVVITRANLVENISDLKSEISEASTTLRVFTSINEIARIAALEDYVSDDPASPVKFHGQNAFAFCGIGNPENFFEQLRRDGISLAGTKAFDDHHIYSQKEVDNLIRLAQDGSAVALLTTAKDAVKLSDLKFEIPCFVVEIRMTIGDADAFNAILHRFFAGRTFLSPQ